MDNLRALPEHGGWQQLAPGVWSDEWGDSYESSRMLLPDLVYRLGVADPVAMVPFRNALMVTNASNADGIEAMVTAAEANLERNRRWLSFKLLRLEGTQWTEMDVPSSTSEASRRLQLAQEATSYESQKELLDRLHEATGTDIFVASFTGLRREGVPLMSYAVWPEGVDTLLPATDLWALSWKDAGGGTEHLLVSRRDALPLLVVAR